METECVRFGERKSGAALARRVVERRLPTGKTDNVSVVQVRLWSRLWRTRRPAGALSIVFPIVTPTDPATFGTAV